MPKSKARFVEIVSSSKSDDKLKTVLEIANKELKDKGLPSVVAIYKTADRKKRHGYSTNDVLKESDFKLLDRIVKKHLKKLGGK